MSFKKSTELILLSALLLVPAFPKFNLSAFAWMAFVPAFFAVGKASTYRQAFAYFFLFGYLFFTAVSLLRFFTDGRSFPYGVVFHCEKQNRFPHKLRCTACLMGDIAVCVSAFGIFDDNV